jgi:hypothetical protein
LPPLFLFLFVSLKTICSIIIVVALAARHVPPTHTHTHTHTHNQTKQGRAALLEMGVVRDGEVFFLEADDIQTALSAGTTAAGSDGGDGV